MDINQFKNRNLTSPPAQQAPEVANTQPATPEVEVAGTEAAENAANKGPEIIAAKNPTPEQMQELCSKVQVNYNFQVDVKPVKFNFKKSVDKDTGKETIRQALELPIPIPSIEGVLAILEAGGKQLELLLDVIGDTVIQTARDLISEDYELNADNFPFDKLSWEAIANMPKAARRGGGIPKEVWEEFEKDYFEVMVAATDKKPEAVANAAKIMVNRLSSCKTNIAVLEFVIQQLSIYAEHTQRMDEFKEVVEFLVDKADSLINTKPEDLLANLL